jgi:hypothetical protein
LECNGVGHLHCVTVIFSGVVEPVPVNEKNSVALPPNMVTRAPGTPTFDILSTPMVGMEEQKVKGNRYSFLITIDIKRDNN